MRNIVAPDYANMDLKIVWDVATGHAPEVCAVLENFFAAQTSTGDAPSKQPG
jgi:uncharacterized protein with HEPN domain